MEQFTPGSTAYTLAPARRIRGPYDRIALDAALTDLVARHEVLRTVFPATEDGTAHAVVAEPAPFGAEFLDLSQEPDPGVREARAAEAVEHLLARPFVLAEGPLLRVLLVRIEEHDHVLALVMHHIVCDGWSIDLLQRELDALHAHHTHGTPHGLAEPRLQYGDYAAWQRGRLADGTLTASRDHWRTELDGVPALELRVDRPRPPTFTFEGAAHEFRWDRALSERITEVAAAYGASRYMVLMAAYQTLLSRHSGQGDFAVGSPVAGRLHSELEPLVGIFVNMLPIRARITPDLTFARLLGQVRERTLDAYAHQEVPFEQIVGDLAVERDVSRAAVFQATLAFQNYGESAVGAATGAPHAEGFGYRATTTHHDLALYLRDEADGGVYGLFTYRTDLFEAATVERLAERFEVLLTAALADPGRTLGALPLLADGERARLAAWSAGPALTVQIPRTLSELLSRAAAETPGAVALTDGRDSLSYGELERRATGLGHRLRALGVGPGAVVALCLEQSPELAVAMLGVLKPAPRTCRSTPNSPPPAWSSCSPTPVWRCWSPIPYWPRRPPDSGGACSIRTRRRRPPQAPSRCLRQPTPATSPTSSTPPDPPAPPRGWPSSTGRSSPTSRARGSGCASRTMGRTGCSSRSPSTSASPSSTSACPPAATCTCCHAVYRAPNSPTVSRSRASTTSR